MSTNETTEPDTADKPAADSGPPEPTGGAWWRLGLPAVGLVALALLWSPAMVVVILGVLGIVAVHEAGHLIAARRSGVAATEYSICVGPVIYSRRAAGMSWTLRAIPLGAFVRVIGMSAADAIAPDEEATTYRRATLPRRLAIVLAGPGANFVLSAVLLVASLTMWGTVDPARWEISGVAEGSPADMAGIGAGDRVTAIDGVTVTTPDDLIVTLEPLAGKRVTVELARGEASRTVEVDVAERVAVWGTVAEDLVLDVAEGNLTVAGVTPGGALERGGLERGDQVVAVAGTPVTSSQELAEAISGLDGGRLELELVRDGGRADAVVDLGVDVAVSAPRGVIGVSPETPVVPLSLPAAVPEAASQLSEIGAASAKGIVTFLWPPNLVSFVTGAVSTPEVTKATPAAASDPAADPNRILSVVGAVGIGADFAAVDVGALLFFLALMSLFIGLFNLVPLPPFDGGHIVVALYEAVRERFAPGDGRYLTSPRVLNRVATAVFAVLLCVGAAAIWLDITSPVS